MQVIDTNLASLDAFPSCMNTWCPASMIEGRLVVFECGVYGGLLLSNYRALYLTKDYIIVKSYNAVTEQYVY